MAPDVVLALPPAEVRLMPERAVHVPATGTLFVADVHLGKAAVFRARGIPVPHGTTADTLDRLAAAVARSGATRLVVLGDFLHARESRTSPAVAALAAWRQAHAGLECLVVEGNHDRHAGQVQAALGFHTLDGDYREGALRGVHDPADAPAAPADGDPAAPWTLAGHVHPVVTLRSRLDKLRLPCFWRHGRVLVLPAFGAFTGGYEVRPAPGDALFAVGERVMALAARAG